jgi:DNA invertase Pin-like site-specific DNA recombinase
MKAIILSRVSSKDQEEGYSIAAQTEKLKEYCQRKVLTLVFANLEMQGATLCIVYENLLMCWCKYHKM